MVKGCINQLITKVSINPLGLFRTSLMLEKSICSIMGYIISHTKIATGILTLKTSRLLSITTLSPAKLPIAIPAIMQSTTQTVKYFSKKPICFFVFVMEILVVGCQMPVQAHYPLFLLCYKN